MLVVRPVIEPLARRARKEGREERDGADDHEADDDRRQRQQIRVLGRRVEGQTWVAESKSRLNGLNGDHDVERKDEQ